MKEPRLYKIMRTLNKEELNSFGDFVTSPFSKSERNTLKLYKYLIKFHPDYSSPRLNKKEIFNDLFKGETYDDRKIENLMFDLTRSAQNFLAHSALPEDEIEFDLLISKQYRNRRLLNQSQRLNEAIQKRLKISFSVENDYFSKLKRLNQLKHDFYTEKNDFENLSKCSEELIESSALQFVFEYINFLTNRKTNRHNLEKEIESKLCHYIEESFDLEKLMGLLEKDHNFENLFIKLQYVKFKTVKFPDNPEYYDELKDKLLKNLSSLDREEKWYFIMHLLNYCSERNLSNEAMNIYRIMLEHDAYSPLENGYFHVINFRNLVMLSTMGKDTEILGKFVKDYSDCLDPEHRDNLKHFGCAHLFFVKGEFGKSLENISVIDNEFFLFRTDATNLVLKNHYELGNFLQAFSIIDTFKRTIGKNKKLNSNFKKQYENYIRFYKDLLKIKSGEKHKKDPSIVKEEIKKEQFVVSKQWLLEKADELIEKIKKLPLCFVIMFNFKFVHYFLESNFQIC